MNPFTRGSSPQRRRRDRSRTRSSSEEVRAATRILMANMLKRKDKKDRS